MRRIFIRLSLIMVAVLVAGIAIASIAFREATIYSYEQNPPSVATFVEELVKQANVTMDYWQFQEFFQQITDKNADMALVENIDDELPMEVVEELGLGNVVWLADWEWPDHKSPGGLVVYLPGTISALVLRPAAQPFPPISAWLTILVALSVVIIAAGLIFLVPIVRRLRELETKANLLAAGKFSALEKRDYPQDAIGYLAEAMDEMGFKIKNSLEKQSHMIMAIAHELRTPISRIQFGLEMLSMASDPDKRQARRQAIETDIVELDQMVAELLTYSRYDSQPEAHQSEIVEVPLLETLNLLKERLGFNKPNIAIEIKIGGNLQKNVYLALHSFNRVLSNLLGNALRYAQSKIVIECLLEKEDLLLIHVDDDGTGIPPEQRQRIFEPFTRLERSRERDKGGVGLGLAIVAQIMRSVGGKVVIEDAPIGGARFTLSWPIRKEQG